MSIQEHAVSRHHALNWNVVRSQAVPSNVGGSRPNTVLATTAGDRKAVAVGDRKSEKTRETVSMKLRKTTVCFDQADAPVSKS